MRRTRAFLPCALVLCLGCAHRPPPRTEAVPDRSGEWISSSGNPVDVSPLDDRVASLPTCGRAEPQIPATWQQVSLSDTMTLRLPPGSTSVAAPLCHHGCSRWERGTLVVEVVYGYWGVDSFGEALQRGCRSQHGRLSVVEMRGAAVSTVILWLAPETELHMADGVIVQVEWVSADDAADADRVIASVAGSGA